MTKGMAIDRNTVQNPRVRVSAIVPLFDKERTVERSLSSITAQTFQDFEIIVIDDGSGDSGPALVRAFPDPRVRLICQANVGPGGARNRGIAEARGDYLAFLDADDEWMPDFLESAVRFLDADPALAAVTFAWLDQPGSVPSAPAFIRRGLRDGIQPVSPALPLSLLLTMVVFMSPVSTVARVDVVRRFGGFYEKGVRFGEDGHLWIKVLLNEPVRFVMRAGAQFHREASALSGNRRAMRSVEPFLTAPDDVRRVCPEPLRDLLERFLCMRAFKTACTLAYWNQWREGAALRRRFYHPGCRTSPLNLISRMVTNPLGSMAGYLDRFRRGIR
jgi:glycosyltransferase involved in cell wall biosynthesis